MSMPEPYKVLVKLTKLLESDDVNPFDVMDLCTEAMEALDRYTNSYEHYDSADIVGTIVRRHIGEAQRKVGLQ